MSVDALTALAATDAQLSAQLDAELAQLAVDAQALRALLVEDMVVTARVLPSNGLTDLVEIAGRRVSALLPANVRPGEVLQVRVAGFEGDSIVLKIVAVSPPDPAAATVAGPPLKLSPGNIAVPVTPDPAVAPVFPPVVPPADGETSARGVMPDIPVAVPREQPGPGFTSAVSRANVAAPDAPAATSPPAVAMAVRQPVAMTVRQPVAMTVRQPVAPLSVPTTIEARLAAGRAAARTVSIDPEAEAAPPSTEAPAAAARSRFVAPPRIEPKAGTTPPAAARGSRLAAFAEPIALLRALRLPVTPSNVASARLALESPQRLPETLAALERALPQANGDPNVATLRTLLAFVGRIDPRSPALAAQIAAYVDHVVDGAEPKIATLLAASRAAAPDPDPSAGVKPLPAAVAAERGAALNGDLKQTLMALAADPATPASVAPSLAGALTALTAVQVTAAQTLAANPNGLAFTIPLTTPYGTSNAHISVKRDAPDARGGARLDAENFRIAFVLETAHYGTVAIDLVTIGREVTVDVRTEAATAMRAFRDALGSLTARLESMRYRVAAAGASVGTTSTVAVEAPPSAPTDSDATVDRSA
jgi:hypothetical protein